MGTPKKVRLTSGNLHHSQVKARILQASTSEIYGDPEAVKALKQFKALGKVVVPLKGHRGYNMGI